MSDKILADTFVPFGEIVDITIPKPELPTSTDPHRGFGYIEFELPGDAKEAIDNMDQSELFGRVIKVAAAKPQKDSNEGLGSKMAVWESVSLASSLPHYSSDSDHMPRRVILQSMPLAKKTGKQRHHDKKTLRRSQETQCKVLKA